MFAMSDQRWIPVSERLPEGREEVLGWQTWVPDAYWGEGVFVCSRVDRDGEFLKAGEWWTEDDRLPNITHWMPLPTPPDDATSDSSTSTMRGSNA